MSTLLRDLSEFTTVDQWHPHATEIFSSSVMLSPGVVRMIELTKTSHVVDLIASMQYLRDVRAALVQRWTLLSEGADKPAKLVLYSPRHGTELLEQLIPVAGIDAVRLELRAEAHADRRLHITLAEENV